MAGSVIFEERLEVPLGLATLADFRRWALSDDFPEQGRIDYLQGSVEVDMSPENLFSHGAPKVELVRVLAQRVKLDRLGHLFTDRTRVSSPAGNISAEPDLVYVSRNNLRLGTVRFIASAAQIAGQYVELEGAPDLVVEIVSQSSVVKDTRRLPEAFFQAGVQEFWLVDARGREMLFQIHHRGATGFVPVPADDDGFQRSAVFNHLYRLERQPDPDAGWLYDLEERPMKVR